MVDIQSKHITKQYVSFDSIYNDIHTLYNKIKQIPVNIDCIVAIGTGGFIPARLIKNYIEVPVLTMTVSHYQDEVLQTKTKHIQLIQAETEESKFIKGKNILVIDELDDTRTTLAYITNKLLELQPNKIIVGVLHNKDKEKSGILDERVTYISSKKVKDKWIVYPWEVKDIDKHNKLSIL